MEPLKSNGVGFHGSKIDGFHYVDKNLFLTMSGVQVAHLHHSSAEWDVCDVILKLNIENYTKINSSDAPHFEMIGEFASVIDLRIEHDHIAIFVEWQKFFSTRKRLL